jgi:hypothetical protein
MRWVALGSVQRIRASLRGMIAVKHGILFALTVLAALARVDVGVAGARGWMAFGQ